jgi:hypothetical protein
LSGANGNISCDSTPAPANSTPPRTSPVLQPFPAASFTNSGCTIAYDAHSATNTWNGRWISIRVTLHSSTDAVNGYRCDPSIAENCWVQLSYTPAPGSALDDATTWAAQLGQ